MYDFRPAKAEAIGASARVGDQIYTGTIDGPRIPRRFDELRAALAARYLVLVEVAPFYFAVERRPVLGAPVAGGRCSCCGYARIAHGRCQRCLTRQSVSTEAL